MLYGWPTPMHVPATLSGLGCLRNRTHVNMVSGFHKFLPLDAELLREVEFVFSNVSSHNHNHCPNLGCQL